MKKISINLHNASISLEDDADNQEFIEKYISKFFEEIIPQSQIQSNQNFTDVESDKIVANQQIVEIMPLTKLTALDVFGVDDAKLAYIINLSNNNINIIVKDKILRGTKAEMQVKLALLYTGACEFIGQTANTKEVRKVCEKYKCLDGNFAPNIKKPNYFTFGKGANADIWLTMPGKDKLQEVVKEISDAISASN